ncbi:hypothetical protein U1Q18_018383 [Sarracenia purpurea var. burkii]
MAITKYNEVWCLDKKLKVGKARFEFPKASRRWNVGSIGKGVRMTQECWGWSMDGAVDTDLVRLVCLCCYIGGAFDGAVG